MKKIVLIYLLLLISTLTYAGGYNSAYEYVDRNLTNEETLNILKMAREEYKRISNNDVMKYIITAIHYVTGKSIEDIINELERGSASQIQSKLDRYLQDKMILLLTSRQISGCDWKFHITSVKIQNATYIINSIDKIFLEKLAKKAKQMKENNELIKYALHKQQIVGKYEITRYIIEAVRYITCKPLLEILNDINEKPYKLVEYLDDDRILIFVIKQIYGDKSE